MARPSAAVDPTAIALSDTGDHRWRRDRQVSLALLPVVSFTILAWLPLLELALIRRRARDWVMFAASLAALAAEIAIITLASTRVLPTAGVPAAVQALPLSTMILLLVVAAPVYILVAFRPAAALPSLSDAQRARAAGKRQKPVMEAMAPDRQWGLRVRCAECGAETSAAAEFCARCGAPAVGPRSVGVGHAAARPGDSPAPAPAADAGPPPAWIRRGQPYFMISMIFFLILYLIAVVGFSWTQGSGLHHPMEWIILLSVGGALLSVVLFEAARNQFRPRQLAWGLVPILSLSFLAFVPFLWLALVRRRARDWAVFAAYLAAVATAIVLFGPVYQVSAAQLHFGAVVFAGLLVVAPLHAALAFSPVGGPTTFREAKAARAAGEHQDPVTGAVAPEYWRQDAAGLTSKSGLGVGCAECGAPVVVTQACAECGAPPVGQRA